MKTTHGPLRGHGDADDLSREGISDPHPVPEDYYHDQNHRDSQRIFAWVVIGALLVGLAIAIRKICGY